VIGAAVIGAAAVPPAARPSGRTLPGSVDVPVAADDSPVELRRTDLRLAPAAAAAWGGCGWAVVAQPPTTFRWAAGCAVVTACLLLTRLLLGAGFVSRRSSWALLDRTVATLSLAAVVAAIALTSAGLQAQLRTAGVAGPLVSQGATVTVDAVVKSDPRLVRPKPGRQDGERWLVRIEADTMTGRGRSGPVRTPLAVLGGPLWSGVEPGQRLSSRGRLIASEPGDDVVALLLATGAPQVTGDPGPVLASAAFLREGLRQACSRLPPDARGLLPALVVGDTSSLPADLEADMRSTGLTHLSAVSGANFTILSGAVLLALTAAGTGRRTRLLAAAIAAVGFVVLARPEPSVLRAAVMGLVGLLGLGASRRGGGAPALCVAVVVLCAVDPWMARALGFALSVLATAGLLLLARPWAQAMSPVLPRPVAVALAVPLAAQAVCGPVTVLIDPRVPLVAVAANVLVAPAVAPATVLGVVAVVLAPVWPQGAAAVAWVAGWSVRWIALVARAAADLPFAAVPWPAGPPGALLLAATSALLAIAAAALLHRFTVRRARPAGTHGSSWWSRGGGGRAAATGWIAAAGVLVLLAVVALAPPGVLTRWVPGGWPGTGWQVAACDVGQGQAVVLRSGPDAAVVVDVGPDPTSVDRCLTRLGIRRIDLLVLTHFHADHVDGLSGALRGRLVRAALVSPLEEPASGAETALAALAEAGIRPERGRSGQVGSAGWVRYEVLGPAEPADSSSAVATESDPNEASVVLHLRAGALVVLATGDAELQGQRSVLAVLDQRPDLVPVDVITVAHHGSATQVSGLYMLAAPRLALVSVGTDNDYGHPAATTLDMLVGMRTTVARTDQTGDISVGGSSEAGSAATAAQSALWVAGRARDP